MRPSDVTYDSNSPLHSTTSTFCSFDEILRQSHFPLASIRHRKSRETLLSGKIPRLLKRCSSSARNLLARDRSPRIVIEDRQNSRRHSYGSLPSVTERSSTSQSLRKRKEVETTRQSSSIGFRDGSEDLQLFRDEAEYSDYLLAHVTGQHFNRSEDGVIFYEVQVHLSKQQWCIVHRFSEFRALRLQLIKHLSRSKRRRQPHCPICDNVLTSIVNGAFPSRKVWGSHLFSKLTIEMVENEIICERKVRFQQFVVMCLLTIRSLRQHLRVLPDNSSCETSVLLRLIEEFLGLSFARYFGFLTERGIVDQTPKCLLRKRSLRQPRTFRASSDITLANMNRLETYLDSIHLQ
ncbi:putative Phox domain, PX domain superfamily protein [Plasmopara halstedii]